MYSIRVVYEVMGIEQHVFTEYRLYLIIYSLQITLFRPTVVSELEAQLSGNVDLSNTALLVVAATIYCHEENYEGALRVLNQSDALEW